MKLLCWVLGHENKALDKKIKKTKAGYFAKLVCKRCGRIINRKYYKLNQTLYYDNELVSYISVGEDEIIN